MIINATYQCQGLPKIYRGNPLVEALPPILEPSAVRKNLTRRPSFDIAEIRQLPLHLRLHEAAGIEDMFVPRPETTDIEAEVSCLLRGGYVPRAEVVTRIITPGDVQSILEAQRELSAPMPRCLLLTGLSGSGKTRTVRLVLSLIPQSIVHSAYAGRPFPVVQVNWLSVDAPVNGSIQGLLDRVFTAFDRVLHLSGDLSYREQWQGKAPIDRKIGALAQIASTYRLGLLHIDDLQRLTETGAKASQMALNLIIQWSNVVRVPLLLSGTHKAVELLASSFEAGRRAGSAGEEEFCLAESPEDPHFGQLMKALSYCQWLDRPIALDMDIQNAIFGFTQALPGPLLTLWRGAHKQAAKEKATGLELRHFEAAYAKDLRVLHPALEALRSRQADRFQLYEDLLPKNAAILQAHQRRAERFADRRKRVVI